MIKKPFSDMEDSQDEKKICRVCGDKAHAINFNVLTCESCKAFFRRNALEAKDYQCVFGSRCSITVATRKSCKQCRLQKCFDVGMMKEFIMSDEDRAKKRKLIQENRVKRLSLMRQISNSDFTKTFTFEEDRETSAAAADVQGTTHIWQSYLSPLDQSISSTASLSNNPTPAPSDASEPEELVSVSKSFLASLIFQANKERAKGAHVHKCQLHYNQSDHMSTTCCAKNCTCCTDLALDGGSHGVPHESARENFQVFKKLKIDKSNNRMVMASRGISVYALLQDMEAVNISRMNIGLSAIKLAHLNGLKSAFRIMYDRFDFDSNEAMQIRRSNFNSSDDVDWPLLPLSDIIARYDDLIRRIVKFCHRVPAFSYLSQNDQATLVKGGIEELVVLRALHAWLPEQDGWRHTNPLAPVTPLSILKFYKGNVYALGKKMFNEFPRIYVDDPNIYLSLLTMILFNPNLPRLENRESVRVVRDFHLNTLNQYLISIHGTDKGAAIFSDVIDHLESFRRTAVRVVLNIILELDSNDLEPLLIEAYGF